MPFSRKNYIFLTYLEVKLHKMSYFWGKMILNLYRNSQKNLLNFLQNFMRKHFTKFFFKMFFFGEIGIFLSRFADFAAKITYFQFFHIKNNIFRSKFWHKNVHILVQKSHKNPVSSNSITFLKIVIEMHKNGGIRYYFFR